MKTLFLFISILMSVCRSAQAAIVFPTINLVDVYAVGDPNSRLATFQLTVDITAVNGPLLIDASISQLKPSLRSPGSGVGWGYTPDSSPLTVSNLNTAKFTRVSPTFNQDVLEPWGVTRSFGIPEGATSTFIAEVKVSVNPFEQNPGNLFLALQINYANWGSAVPPVPSETPNFTDFDTTVYRTPLVQITHAPEPGTALLLLAGSMVFLARRRRLS